MLIRRATPDEEAIWFSNRPDSDIDPWFQKHIAGEDIYASMGPDKFELPPQVKTKFDLPVHETRSQRHLNRFGNSWECGSLNKF